MNRVVVVFLLLIVIVFIGVYRGITQENIWGGNLPDPLVGSWLLQDGDWGFELLEDGRARSINASTLQYRRWKRNNDRLILTELSLGNHSASISDSELMIQSLDGNRLVLSSGDGPGVEYYRIAEETAQPHDPAPINTNFEYYPVDLAIDEISMGPKHPVNFGLTPEERRKTISAAYDAEEDNFAGYYTLITWETGKGRDGVLIDSRTGAIYPLPASEEAAAAGVSHTVGSVLLEVVYAGNGENGENSDREAKYWLWNEDAKEFVRL